MGDGGLRELRADADNYTGTGTGTRKYPTTAADNRSEAAGTHATVNDEPDEAAASDRAPVDVATADNDDHDARGYQRPCGRVGGPRCEQLAGFVKDR